MRARTERYGKDIQRAAKGALVARGLSIYGSSVDQAKPALEKWTKGLSQ
ncbi:MAG: hypothetical protein ACLTXT_08295 [Ruminococcus callidus]